MLSKSVLTSFLLTLLFLPIVNMFFLRGMRSLSLDKASSSLRQLNPVFNHVLLRSTSSKVFSSNNANIQTVLICGPSGVGKGTLITRLLADYAEFVLSVSLIPLVHHDQERSMAPITTSLPRNPF